MASDGWEGILFPGERVIWQGQPDPRPDFSGMRLAEAVFGVAAAGFAVFWMSAALGGGEGGFMGLVFPLLGLPFLVIGLQKAGFERLWEAFVRTRTWYTLTDRRAFIATALFGRRRLDAYPIGPKTPLSHENGRDVFFATDFVTGKRGERRRKIGFTHLRDSAAVYDRMRRIKEDAT